jgi:hypothetical protein
VHLPCGGSPLAHRQATIADSGFGWLVVAMSPPVLFMSLAMFGPSARSVSRR